MHEDFRMALFNLEDVDCEEYVRRLIRVLAALSNAVDECAPERVREEIGKRFRNLIGVKE